MALAVQYGGVSALTYVVAAVPVVRSETLFERLVLLCSEGAAAAALGHAHSQEGGRRARGGDHGSWPSTSPMTRKRAPKNLKAARAAHSLSGTIEDSSTMMTRLQFVEVHLRPMLLQPHAHDAFPYLWSTF